ncbi:hypothetical protein HGRIS_008234 [Hohenbuehelia grisea]|uniref:NADP-dependent oxidoreductase domain-containing protein n=1 Tax=Hohenbuehelia grisea TaxID=104357 RepID=A0ABR3J879_9AGAR
MATVVLKRTGQKMPLVGFGLWKVTKATCAETVYSAIKAGYRLFDGAGDYGNEKEAGKGVQRAIKEGLLWNTFHKREHVHALTKLQLELWGIEYFDLFLVHFPIALQYVEPSHRYPPEWWGDDGKVYLQNTPMHETWGAMEEIVDAGFAKNIGLSNSSGSIILDVLRYARIEPAVLQVEIHPYLTQDNLIDLAKTLGIALTAYSSFGPQSYVELGVDKGVTSLLSHDVVAATAQAHKKTAAQVLLRWSTQRGIAVVPKSNSQARLVENLDCNSFDISEEEIKKLSSLNINLRLNDPRDIDPRLAIFA